MAFYNYYEKIEDSSYKIRIDPLNGRNTLGYVAKTIEGETVQLSFHKLSKEYKISNPRAFKLSEI